MVSQTANEVNPKVKISQHVSCTKSACNRFKSRTRRLFITVAEQATEDACGKAAKSPQSERKFGEKKFLFLLSACLTHTSEAMDSFAGLV